MEMFRQGRGELFDFMKGIGRPMEDCGRATPLALMLDRGVLNARWLVAHLNELTEEDFQLLQVAPKFHIVHCPRSHAHFGHSSSSPGEAGRIQHRLPWNRQSGE